MKRKSQYTDINRNMLLFVILITSLINPFLGAAVNIALPRIGEEFSMNAVSMSWVAMSFLLASAVFLVPIGKAADILGRRKIFLYGNMVVAISSLFCALSVSGIMLIICRLVQGIGSAMIFGTGMAIITSAFPPHERGKAIGINVSAVYLGLSIAPFAGGFFTQLLGWRSLFLMTLPFAILVVIFVVLFFKSEWADARNEKFDYTGSVIYIIAVSLLMYGFSKLPETYAFFLTGTGIIGLVLFIRIELSRKYPVLDIRLFRANRTFAFSNLAALINYAATFAITFVLSLYLQYIKGMKPIQAGSVLVTQPFIMMIVASFSGRMSDRRDPRILSSLGMAIIVAGLVLLSFLEKNTGKVYIIFSLLILGTGFGLFSSPNTNAIMGSVEKKYLGIASATVGTMRLTGQMVSMGVATMIIHALLGEESISMSNHHLFLTSVRIIFILFSFLCFLGIFASLARGKSKSIRDNH